MMRKNKYPCFCCEQEIIDENFSLDNIEEKFRKLKPQYAHIAYLPVSTYENPYNTMVGGAKHRYLHAECFFNMFDEKTLELFEKAQAQKFINSKFLTCFACSQYTRDAKHSSEDEVRITLFCKGNDPINNSLTFHAKCFCEKLGIKQHELIKKFTENRETT